MHTPKRHSKFLISLLENYKCQIIAEIGVYKGKCYKAILDNYKQVKEYWAIDQYLSYNDPSFKMGTLSQDDWDRIYLRNCEDMKYFPQLKVIKSKSEAASTIWKKPYFDFVFIDGDHDKETVLTDIRCWKRLVKPGGILAGHDYSTGRKKGHSVADAVNESFEQSKIQFGQDAVWYVEL